MWIKNYDSWKLMSPDEEPGRTYDCDCCGKPSRNVEQCWTSTGMETFACPACRGEDEEEPPEPEPEPKQCPRCAMPPVGKAPQWPDCSCPTD